VHSELITIIAVCVDARSIKYLFELYFRLLIEYANLNESLRSFL
jgi:hypothetical protein